MGPVKLLRQVFTNLSISMSMEGKGPVYGMLAGYLIGLTVLHGYPLDAKVSHFTISLNLCLTIIMGRAWYRLMKAERLLRKRVESEEHLLNIARRRGDDEEVVSRLDKIIAMYNQAISGEYLTWK